MSEIRDLLGLTAALSSDFYDTLGERPVFPRASPEELRASLGGPLPEEPAEPRRVVADLAAAADAGLVAGAGGRYFGFVTGGSLPAALGADWLASAWDQNAGLHVASPAAAVVEEVAGAWLLELLGLPATASFAFVTGGQMANFTALAAARHQVLARAGWDVEAKGLSDAPTIRVLAGEQRHTTIERALRFLGLGGSTELVPADEQGRMLVRKLRIGGEPTIVCAQAGEVNTGAFDPFGAIADACENAPNAWLHVDGAFGLWAAVPPSLRHLVAGVERADSWAADAHKWLNVPYDSGLAFCAHPEAHRSAMTARASYLVVGDEREEVDWNPEASRRARGFAVYAALRSLGRSGVSQLVERTCAHARRLAAGLHGLGAELLNEVVLNQVLFRFESDEETERVLGSVQRSGEAWLGGTVWAERPAIRLSVSSWQTTETDVERTLAAFRAALHGATAAR